MSETQLIDYYQAELEYLRRRSEKFSEDHPAVASELQLNRGRSEDPHIEMLLQSFAFLTGRLQYRLSSEAAEISNSLLNLLYPHLTAPLPSMMVVKAMVDPGAVTMEKGYFLKKGSLTSCQVTRTDGRSHLATMSVGYSSQLWPLQVAAVALEDITLYPDLVRDGVRSALRVQIRSPGNADLGSIDPGKLRFFLGGSRRHSALLYRLLSGSVQGVAWASDAEGRGEPEEIDARVRWLGFERDEALLPYSDVTHQGYRLLQEYFAFPEKFLFFDLESLPEMNAGKTLDLLFLLDAPIEDPPFLQPEDLQLNCVPLVNLFPKITDPIRLDHTREEYLLVPDERQYRTCEVHTVEDVFATGPDSRVRRLQPLYGQVLEPGGDEQDRLFWTSRRERSQVRSIPGTELYLAVHDLALDRDSPLDESLHARTLCTNRSLLEGLRLDTVIRLEGSGLVSEFKPVTRPTRHQSPELQGRASWRLVSLLGVNYLSLCDDEAGLGAFKQILRLHAGEADATRAAQIRSIDTLKSARSVARIREDAWRGFCYGYDIEMRVDEVEFQGRSIWLFGDVMSHFLGLFAAVNSFVRLTLVEKRKGESRTWHPRVGDQALL